MDATAPCSKIREQAAKPLHTAKFIIQPCIFCLIYKISIEGGLVKLFRFDFYIRGKSNFSLDKNHRRHFFIRSLSNLSTNPKLSLSFERNTGILIPDLNPDQLSQLFLSTSWEQKIRYYVTKHLDKLLNNY